MKLFLAEHNPQ